MNWKEAIEEARDLLGFGHHYLNEDDWNEVVSTAKSIIRTNRDEEYYEFCHDLKLYYDNYMKSNEWRITRKEVLQRDKHKCFDCGGIAVHVHHLKYDNLGKPLEKNDCICLCAECHFKRHKDNFIGKGSRIWFEYSSPGVFYTLYYCPACKCQRTWHSAKKNVFVCDHCHLGMLYVPGQDRFRIQEIFSDWQLKEMFNK